jgi:hypothetical protein
LFSCFGSANEGLPFNPRIAYYYENRPDPFGFTPNPYGFGYRDLGLGTFLRSGFGSGPPSRGAACFDCHSNGHTNKATHLAPDARPQESRHRIVTPTLRGVQIQRLFGSQLALNSVEDFTQFEGLRESA